jgi:predicted dehydrogenase
LKGKKMPEQLSVAVIGAGMAGRSHAAGFRMVNTVFGEGLPPIRLAAVADANTALAEDGARRYGYEKALPTASP